MYFKTYFNIMNNFIKLPLFCLLISITSSLSYSQIPEKVKNKNTIQSYGLYKFNNTIFCKGTFGNNGPYLLKYNVVADSFELVLDSNSKKIPVSSVETCFYEINNKFIIKTGGLLISLDKSFQVTILKNVGGSVQYIYPHTEMFGKFIFAFQNEIWITDGTLNGTYLETTLPLDFPNLELISCGNYLLIIGSYGGKYYKYVYDLISKQLINKNYFGWNTDEVVFNEALCFGNTLYNSCIGNSDTCFANFGGTELYGIPNGTRFIESNNLIFYQTKTGTFSIDHNNKNLTKIINSKPPANGITPVKLLKNDNFIGFFNSTNGFTLYSYDVLNSMLDSINLNNNLYSAYISSTKQDNYFYFKSKEGIYRADLSKVKNTKLIFDPTLYNLNVWDTTTMVIYNNSLYFSGSISNNRSIYKIDLASITNTLNPQKQNSWQIIYDQNTGAELKFYSDDFAKEAEIEIYTIAGTFILKNHFRNTNNIRVDIGDLKPGFYISVLTSDSQKKSFRFIKTF